MMDTIQKQRLEELKRASEFHSDINFPVDLLRELNDRELLHHIMSMTNTVITRWKADFLRTTKQFEHRIEELEKKLTELKDE